MYSVRFLYCVNFLIDDIEKGYNPDDPSMYGISQAWLEKLADCPALIRVPNPSDLQNMSPNSAVFFYHWGFWQKYHLSLLPKPLDLIAFCFLVHRETVAQETLKAVLKFPTPGQWNLSTLATLGAWTLEWGDESRALQNPDGTSVWRKHNVHKVCLDFLLSMAQYYSSFKGEKNYDGYIRRMELIKAEAEKEWVK